jgi:CRISPR/Cas system-associated protein endoribonuclease Cas2
MCYNVNAIRNHVKNVYKMTQFSVYRRSIKLDQTLTSKSDLRIDKLMAYQQFFI